MGGEGCLHSGTTSSPVGTRWKAPMGVGGWGGGCSCTLVENWEFQLLKGTRVGVPEALFESCI